jgi:PAS domain S-box-containing protein
MTDAVYAVNRAGELLYANHSAADSFNCSASDLIGKTIWELYPKETAAKQMESINKVIRERQGHIFIELNVDGAAKNWLRTSIQPLVEPCGDVQSVICVSQDITDQKTLQEERENLANEQQAILVELQKSAHLWETTFNSLSDPITIQDSEFRIVKANKAYVKFMNKKPSEIIGKHCYELFHGASGPIAGCPHMKSLAEGKIETFELHDEINSKVQEITTSPHCDQNGQMVGTIHVVKDITARKNAENMILDFMKKIELANAGLKAAVKRAECMTEKAQRANYAKNQFLATISHEIRTPLNGVMGMSEILMDTPLNEEQTEYARIIRASADSLLTIITDILDFSKIEAGKMDLDAIDFDLRKTLGDCVAIFTGAASDKGLALTVDVHHSVPPIINGDPVRFGQIVSNLISNAFKFTEFGSIAVSIGVEKESDDVIEIIVSVKDTGIGIEENKIGSIFECFSHIDNPLIPKHLGTGLGLSISKRLVGLMHGSIWVTSVAGQGSDFRFTVQFNKAAAALSITN